MSNKLSELVRDIQYLKECTVEAYEHKFMMKAYVKQNKQNAAAQGKIMDSLGIILNKNGFAKEGCSPINNFRPEFKWIGLIEHVKLYLQFSQ